MNKKYMVAILITWSLLLVACAQQKAEMVAEDRMIYDSKGVILQISKKDDPHMNDGNNEANSAHDDGAKMLRMTKQITSEEDVAAVMDILNHTAYIKAKLEQTRLPDYEISVIDVDSPSSSYIIIFGLWLSSDQESYAVVDQTNYRHGRLSKEDSQAMLSLLE